MNIKGILLLKEKMLPLMENLFIFRDFNEIPPSHLDKYKDKKLWSIRAFDDRTKITDTPYNIKSPWFRGLVKYELKEHFNKLKEELEKLKIPEKNRILFICRGFFDEDIEFSGHAYYHDDVIYVDILKGNRPSGKDWNPDLSYKIQIINNKPIYSSLEESNFRKYLIQICNDILKFENNAYLDFSKFKEGYFFYHDLSVIKY